MYRKPLKKVKLFLGREKMDIKIKYFTDEVEKIAPISKGDWIDLRAAADRGRDESFS